MGYIRHHAVIVTGRLPHTDEEKTNLLKAHEKAKEIFDEGAPDYLKSDKSLVSDIVEGTTNYYGSFFIAPDGSKEFWDTSDSFDKCREEFIEFLGSLYLSWAEISFGDEAGKAKILNES